MINKINTEVAIMNKIKHKFILSSDDIFQNNNKLFIISDFIEGGEMFYHLIKSPFNEEKARFYLSQVIITIEYLHSYNIIYRDIKPENILINNDGNIKLCDFGLSKKLLIKNDLKTLTICGTPSYNAPEMIKKNKYDFSVDIWSLGVLLYEMLTQRPCFTSKDKLQLHDKILHKQPKYPKYLSNQSKLLISNLLIKDPNKRLGNNRNFDEIKNHSFFPKNYFNKIQNNKINTPFIPNFEFGSKTKYVHKEFLREPCFIPKFRELDSPMYKKFKQFKIINV